MVFGFFLLSATPVLSATEQEKENVHTEQRIVSFISDKITIYNAPDALEGEILDSNEIKFPLKILNVSDTARYRIQSDQLDGWVNSYEVKTTSVTDLKFIKNCVTHSAGGRGANSVNC